MPSSLPPAVVAGHWVKNPRLVSVGCHGRRMVYAVSSDTVASLAVAPDAASILPGPGEGSVGGAYASVAGPGDQVISFVSVHPAKDLLCVGTENHGIYLTQASSPELSAATRLPLEASGERSYSGCFLNTPTHRSPAVAAAALPSAAPRPASAGYAAPLKRNQQQPPPAPPSSATTGGAAAEDEEEDLLVFSSTFKDKRGPNPHRLTVFATKERSIWWRGAMEPLDSLCAFPGEWGFGACAGAKVSLFNVQWTPHSADTTVDGPSPQQAAATPSRRAQRGKATLLSRLCTTVDDLREAEYVQCAVPGSSSSGGGRPDPSLVAVTSNGYMVAFDRESGSVARWMDCKVCPARSVHFAGGNVLITGAMLRFFDAESWDFGGKVKPDVPSNIASSSYLGKLLSSTFTAAVPLGRSAVAVFSGSGEAFVYRCARPASAAGTSAASAKLQLQQLSHCSPIAATEGEFLWARASFVEPLPSRKAGKTELQGTPNWCLWSPQALRVLTPGLCVRSSVALPSTAAVYHSPSQVLLAYDGPAHEIVAFAAGDDWREWGRMDHAETFTCLAASASSELCAGYSERSNTLTVFSCAWTTAGEGGGKSLLMQRSYTVSLPRTCKSPVRQVFFVDSKAFVVTTTSLLETDTGVEHTVAGASEEVIKACPVGRDVLVLSNMRCSYYVPETRELKDMNIAPARLEDHADEDEQQQQRPLWELVDLAYEPICDLVAVCDAHRITVARLLDNAVIRVIRHSEPARSDRHADPRNGASPAAAPAAIKAIDLHAGPAAVVLTVIDTAGHITEYVLEDKKIELTSPRQGGTRPGMAPPGAAAHRRPATATTTAPPARNGSGYAGVAGPTHAPTQAPTATPSPATVAARPVVAQKQTRGRPVGEVKAPATGRSNTTSGGADKDAVRAARRRAVSAGAPSGRELENRFEALAGYYELQKTQAMQLPSPRRTSSPCGPSGTMPDFPHNATVYSSEVSDSPPHTTGTARRGGQPPSGSDSRTDAAPEAGTSMAVSALTLPSTVTSGSRDAVGRRGPPAVAPLACETSPTRKGEFPRDLPAACGEDEVVHSSTAPARRVPAPLAAVSSGSGGRGGGASSRLTEHTRNLRASLLELRELLATGSDPVLLGGGSAEAEQDLEELPSLLTEVADALHHRNTQRSSVAPQPPQDPRPVEAAPADVTSYQFLLAELMRIQQQNARLEEQNKTIMDRLGPSVNR